MQDESRQWMRWTFSEAGTKTLSKILQKVAGNLTSSFAHTFLVTLIVGLIQSLAGACIACIRKTPFIPSSKHVIGSCLFGVCAVIATVLGLAAFQYGASMSVNVFLISLSIVPGALIDQLFFGHRLRLREWSGVILGIMAGYAVLDWPSLKDLLTLPVWVWFSLGNMLAVAINQGITQRIKKTDGFIHNFWGGITTVICSVGALLIMGNISLLFDISDAARMLWFVSIMSGALVVAMWTFNLLSYREGAHIAIKKLVMNGSYLSTSVLAGIIIFSEALTLGKITGIALYVGAFVLMDKGTWNAITHSSSA
ncbi:MAG: hypothetical protein U1A25_03255 [Candidatus Sungbacteria bacterium]|nr:hypothetical protein [bacterium]MDZ4260661.1 hypothetical protein [Candidatus Sungbacteria bacterium]